MSFLALRFFDTFDLVASLPKRLGLFDKPAPGAERGETPRLLAVRAAAAGYEPADEHFVLKTVAGKGKWPELTNLLGRMKRLGDDGGGIEFGLIYLEMLMPGTTLPWSEAMGAYGERYSRAMLALRTNPAAMVYSGAAALHLLPGQLTAMSLRLPSSAVNLGDHPRIHLIADFKKKEAVEP